MARSPLQVVHWYVTVPVMEEFRGYMEMLGEVAEGSDDFSAIIEEIRSLPNFPQGFDPETTHFVPTLTSHTVN